MKEKQVEEDIHTEERKRYLGDELLCRRIDYNHFCPFSRDSGLNYLKDENSQIMQI
jgi:hypothetical protein